MESIKRRKAELLDWLKQTGLDEFSVQAMPGDASFRRYFRISTSKDSFVAMNAESPQENCHAFVAIAKSLRQMGLKTPEIINENLDQGFLLITDFGDATYLKTLNNENADLLYKRALDALSIMRQCKAIPSRIIPTFSSELMWQEWAWHQEWFLEKLLNLKLPDTKELENCYAYLVDSALAQPQVFMHRDYHSANLMVLTHDVGILDFQDAFMGPITYDLVSLLRDCYIAWPEEKVTQWMNYYFQKLQLENALLNQKDFHRWFDLMGIQRHLKALLTFGRKAVRDHAPQYLRHVPRTLSYLISVTERYPELNFLYHHLQNNVKPRVNQLCVPSS